MFTALLTIAGGLALAAIILFVMLGIGVITSALAGGSQEQDLRDCWRRWQEAEAFAARNDARAQLAAEEQAAYRRGD